MTRTFQVLILGGLVFAQARPATADAFTVTLDTSTLSGTQTLAFGFTDGDLAADNTITLSSFTFDGGSAIAGTQDCTLFGTLSGVGCSGDLTSAVTLSDVGFQAFFLQQFVVGASLSFTLTTTNQFAAGSPDQFAMYLCDASFSACYSNDATTGAMLLLALNGEPLSASSFIVTGATDQNLAAPLVTTGPPVAQAVPEPASLFLVAIGIAGAALRRTCRWAPSVRL